MMEKNTENKNVEFIVNFFSTLFDIIKSIDKLFISVVSMLPKRTILFYCFLSLFANFQIIRYCLIALDLMVLCYVFVAFIQSLQLKIQYGGKNGDSV
jgi:hypothetical protein